MEAFFEARTVAVVGASAQEGKVGFELVRSLLHAGFEGTVIPVNPRGDPVADLKTYKDVDEIPEKIDLAVIALPAQQVPEALDACGRKGAKAAVVVAMGFKETGPPGQALEDRVVAAARLHGIRLLGPNSLGLLYPRRKLDICYQPHYAMQRPGVGPIGLAFESGTLGLVLLESLAAEHLGVSRYACFGNAADVDAPESLEYLANDAETSVIGLYVQGVAKARRFFDVLSEATARKPVVLLRGATGPAGAEAALRHTGVNAGNAAAFEKEAIAAGAYVADDLEGMMDLLKLLALQPPPGGSDVAVVSNGMGLAIEALDALEGTPLRLANLEPKTTYWLRENLPPFCSVGNPINLTGNGDAFCFRTALQALEMDDSVDTILPLFAFQNGPLASTRSELFEAMAGLRKSGRTVVAVASGGRFTMDQVRRLQADGFPVLPTARRAVRAIVTVLEHPRAKKED